VGTVRAPRACHPEQALRAFLGMELLHKVGWRSSQSEKEALAPAFEMRILGASRFAIDGLPSSHSGKGVGIPTGPLRLNRPSTTPRCFSRSGDGERHRGECRCSVEAARGETGRSVRSRSAGNFNVGSGEHEWQTFVQKRVCASFSSSLRMFGFTLPGCRAGSSARPSFAVARLFSIWPEAR